MTEHLESALRELSAEVAFPATPELGASVVSRIGVPARRSAVRARWLRALSLAIIASLLIVAAAAALTLILPGLRLTVVPALPSDEVPTDALGVRLALGERTTLDAVDVPTPASLGRPEEVYVGQDGEVVTLVYAASDRLPEMGGADVGLLVQRIAGDLDPARVEKLVEEVGAVVTPVRVDGEQGFWIDGPPHLVRYIAPSGEERAAMSRLAGDTLVWEAGGALYRIESALGLSETQAIAESIGD